MNHRVSFVINWYCNADHDGLLAYEAQASLNIIFKHVATIVFLLVVFFVLGAATEERSRDK